MVVVPGAGNAVIAFTSPEPRPIVAIAGVLLVHVPPGVVCVSVEVSPSHAESVPPIGAGAGVTVTTLLEVQPAVSEYVMVAVPGAGVEDTPVTTPVDEPTVAMEVGLLVQLPPGVLLLNVIVEPSHTVDGPTIGAADATTVIT